MLSAAFSDTCPGPLVGAAAWPVSRSYNAMMKPHDRICYCYDVPLHKLWHFARRRRPRRPSQMSECLGAGTGCGWCIPFLCRIYEEALKAPPGNDAPPPEALIDLTPGQYAERRQGYIENKEPRNQF